ncbi:unnamed protein product, partial [Rotaria socialis]
MDFVELKISWPELLKTDADIANEINELNLQLQQGAITIIEFFSK